MDLTPFLEFNILVMIHKYLMQKRRSISELLDRRFRYDIIFLISIRLVPSRRKSLEILFPRLFLRRADV